MAKKWRDVRAKALATDRLNEARIDEHKKQALATVRARRLADLRDAYGLNQAEVAEKLQVSQSRVSRIERGDVEHTQVATLRGFVEALGGELEITAKIGDERITIG